MEASGHLPTANTENAQASCGLETVMCGGSSQWARAELGGSVVVLAEERDVKRAFEIEVGEPPHLLRPKRRPPLSAN